MVVRKEFTLFSSGCSRCFDACNIFFAEASYGHEPKDPVRVSVNKGKCVRRERRGFSTEHWVDSWPHTFFWLSICLSSQSTNLLTALGGHAPSSCQKDLLFPLQRKQRRTGTQPRRQRPRECHKQRRDSERKRGSKTFSLAASSRMAASINFTKLYVGQ